MKRLGGLTKLKTGLMALFLSALSGCASNHDLLLAHTAKPGISTGFIGTAPFKLMAVQNAAEKRGVESITIYIEGDGRAWLNRSTPSTDPSPRQYMMVDKTMIDQHPAIYLARPCQYQVELNTRVCNTTMWTEDRFSRAVVDAYSSALDSLKHEYQNTRFKLVGYSGGAAVAMALAGERSDISDVVTLAGNVDPNAWVSLHHLSPLGDVVDPVTYGQKLARILQRHFVGKADTVVPASLAQGFVRKIGARCADITELAATHDKGWNLIDQKMIYQSALCLSRE